MRILLRYLLYSLMVSVFLFVIIIGAFEVNISDLLTPFRGLEFIGLSLFTPWLIMTTLYYFQPFYHTKNKCLQVRMYQSILFMFLQIGVLFIMHAILLLTQHFYVFIWLAVALVLSVSFLIAQPKQTKKG
jgi:hypothetical protein